MLAGRSLYCAARTLGESSFCARHLSTTPSALGSLADGSTTAPKPPQQNSAPQNRGQGPREPREARGPREPREAREPKEPREPRAPRENRESSVDSGSLSTRANKKMVARFAYAELFGAPVKSYPPAAKVPPLTRPAVVLEAKVKELMRQHEIQRATETLAIAKRQKVVPTVKTINMLIQHFCNIGDQKPLPDLMATLRDLKIPFTYETYMPFVKMYLARNSVQNAGKLVQQMKADNQSCSPGLDVFNLFMQYFATKAHATEALNTLQQIVEEGFEPDTSSYLYLLHSYLSVGDLAKAEGVAVMMEHSGLSPENVYRELIHLVASKGFIDVALAYLEKAQKNDLLVDSGYLVLLEAYATGGYRHGETQRIVDHMRTVGKQDLLPRDKYFGVMRRLGETDLIPSKEPKQQNPNKHNKQQQ